MHPDLKQQARNVRRDRQQALRRVRRADRRQWRRCFWSWPLGHEYVDTGTSAWSFYECVSCDRPRDGVRRDELHPVP